MSCLATRIAHRYAAVVLRDIPVADELPRDENEEVLATCSNACSVSAEDVRRLLGYAGVQVDAGSVQFDAGGFGEVEINFNATRTDGRPMTGVLVVCLRTDRDGSAVQTYAEVGPIW